MACGDSQSVRLQEMQAQFISIINSSEQQLLSPFFDWVQSYKEKHLPQLNSRKEKRNEDVMLDQIADDIREILPLSAQFPSEQISFPTTGLNADCNPATTVHVDGFLYGDDEKIDEACEEGKMSRFYCKRCGSHETAELNFISHSTSIKQLQYIFKYILPDLRGKCVVDVGSRLGAVLYGAYYYSACPAIFGVEINHEMCQLQEKVMEKYQLQDRIKVICADICTQGELLSKADVVVLHNVFEFFCSLEVQRVIWSFLHQTIKKQGTLLVMTPSLEESLLPLQIDFDPYQWVTPVQCKDNLLKATKELFEDESEADIDSIYLYQVL